MQTEIEGFIQRYKGKAGLAESTKEGRILNARKFGEWLDERGIEVTDVGKRDIETYLSWLNNQGYASNAVQAKYQAVRAIYRDLDVDENPTEDVKIGDYTNGEDSRKSTVLREDVPSVTPAEKEQLAENVPEPYLRNELIIRLLYQTGVRRAELANIRLDDIDWDERSIKIRATKTDSNRWVFFQPSLDVLLDRWVNGGYRMSEYAAEESDYLFPTRSEKIGTRQVNRTVKKAAENAGLQETVFEDVAGRDRKKITAHTLRHSFAVQSLRNGMDLKRLQRLMGHESIETTSRYLDVTKDDVAEAARECGPGTEEIEA